MCSPNSFSDRILLSYASRKHFSESARTAQRVVFLLLIPVGAAVKKSRWTVGHHDLQQPRWIWDQQETVVGRTDDHGLQRVGGSLSSKCIISRLCEVPPFSPPLYYSTKIFATIFFLNLTHLCFKFSEHLCFPDWTMTDILTNISTLVTLHFLLVTLHFLFEMMRYIFKWQHQLKGMI